MVKAAFITLAVLAAVLISVNAGHHHDDHHHDDHHGHYHPYGFGYDVKDGHGNTQYRHEKGSGHEVKGSYGYKDAHGIHRHVDYVADKSGFRAYIKTNEPGTAPKDPAAVKMDSHPVPNPPSHHHGGHGGHASHSHHESSHGHGHH